MYVDLMGTEAKIFIRENEGNAWYFDNADGYWWWNPWFELWHAALYFIHHWNEYLVSYYPTNATDTSWSGEGDMFFWEVDAVSWNWDYNEELANFWKHARWIKKYGDYNSINIKSDEYNSTELYNWYKKEYLELPKYNTFSNNCSDEVKKWLVASWYLEEKTILNQMSTFGLVNIDTPLSLRNEILNK